ncbi:procathepsin L-like [Saccostrea cucullata]|uniref:procathepsin L-like n=1 Tax=Saccostrea cuccullata TaxID=36930 RepID=UPI002ED18DBD
MNSLWFVCLLAAVLRGASVQKENVQSFDIKETQKHTEQLHILKTNAGINYQPYEQAWKEFKILHGKTYKTGKEEIHRFEIFRRNVQKIEEHNRLYHQGKTSYYMGVNQFTDLKLEEFVKRNGLNRTSVKYKGCSAHLSANDLVAPESVDWRKEGYVTAVKNQHHCGSCYTFSTTGAVEGQHFRKTGDLVSLSEQQILDCSESFGNNGCHGGLMDDSFRYIKSVGGIQTEKDYPYTAKKMECKFEHENVAATVSGCVDIERGSEVDLKHALAEVGPVSVGIDASHSSLQFYDGGVYVEPHCSSVWLNHGVLAVGYGTQEGKDYWIVKNSWGPEWGMEGYVLMSRNKDNMCGIATEASYPLV